MKKLLALIMAGCFVLGSLGTAAAIDVKVNGQWEFSYGYYTNRGLYDKDNGNGSTLDNADFRMRARTQIHFIASETLSALLNMEIGDIIYGRPGTGGNLDTDGINVETKRAYLDWIIPGTSIKTRMGIQGIALPMFTCDSNPLLQADVAGVSASMQFTPEVGLTAFWARPFDNRQDDPTSNANFDEMDVFGVMLPVKTSIINITPWAMVSSIGKDSNWYGDSYRATGSGPTSNRGRGRNVPYDSRDDQGVGWWAGLSMELPVIDPFFVRVDAMMGGLSASDSDFDQFGWFAAADIGYKWSWGSTSMIGFYSSGDDGDDMGIMPIISDDWGFTMTSYGLNGGRGINRDSVLSGNGLGMWGLGLKVADVSFVENLSHTARVMFMRGTNNGDAYRNIRNIDAAGTVRPAGALYTNYGNDAYYISSDKLWEFNLDSKYTFNENFSMSLDFAYLIVDLSDQRPDRVQDAENSFAAMLSFQYKF